MRTLQRVMFVMLLSCLVFGATQAAFAAKPGGTAGQSNSWNLATDMANGLSSTSPVAVDAAGKAVWSFGESNSLAEADLWFPFYFYRTLFPTVETNVVGLKGWAHADSYGAQDIMVAVNASGADVHVPFLWPNGVVIAKPHRDVCPVIRWTSPFSGNANLAAVFTDMDATYPVGQGYGFWIMHNGQVLRSANMNEGERAVNTFNLSLKRGDVLSFGVSRGYTEEYASDSTKVEVSIQKLK